MKRGIWRNCGIQPTLDSLDSSLICKLELMQFYSVNGQSCNETSECGLYSAVATGIFLMLPIFKIKLTYFFSFVLFCFFVCLFVCLFYFFFVFILFYFILFYFILFYFILFYFILFYLFIFFWISFTHIKSPKMSNSKEKSLI